MTTKKTSHLTIRVDPGLRTRVRALAEEDGRPVSDVARRLMAAGLLTLPDSRIRPVRGDSRFEGVS